MNETEYKRTPQRPLNFIVEGQRLKDRIVCIFRVPIKNKEQDKIFLVEMKERQKSFLKAMGESDEELGSEFRDAPEIGMMALIVSFKNIHWNEPG